MARPSRELGRSRSISIRAAIGVLLSLLLVECTSGWARSVVPGPAHGEVTDIRPVQWKNAEVGPDDSTLTLRYETGSSACYGLDHADVEYEDDEVVVTLYEGTFRGTGACQTVLAATQVIVRLDEPINGRAIVDGAG